MPKHYKTYTATITPSGGDGEETTKINHLVKQIIVKSTTSTTTYDFGIYDSGGFPRWTKSSGKFTGYFNDEVSLPLDGSITIKIKNASADEAITAKLIYEVTS